MSARTLTNEEYAVLGANVNATASQMKQVHRLLCDGHSVKDLTPSEQACAAVFDGTACVQIANDYGWEPGVKVMVEDGPKSEPKPKPKKNGK